MIKIGVLDFNYKDKRICLPSEPTPQMLGQENYINTALSLAMNLCVIFEEIDLTEVLQNSIPCVKQDITTDRQQMKINKIVENIELVLIYSSF